MATKKEQDVAEEATDDSTDQEAEVEDDRDLLERAKELLAPGGISISDILGEIFPNEADEGDLIRIPQRPSLKMVKSTPVRVVMLEWDAAHSDDPDKPLDRDSEGFDTVSDECLDYYKTNVEFARGDVRELPDRTHLVVLFKDTLDFSDVEFEVVSKNADLKKTIEAKMKDGDIDFIFSGKQKPSASSKTPSQPRARSAERKKVVSSNVEQQKTAPKGRSSAAKKLAAKKAADNEASDEAPKNPATARRKRARRTPTKQAAATSS